ncbi:hypothetical protein pb186bvf_017234 [Paramecium bursaria]
MKYEEYYEITSQLIGQGAFSQVFLAIRKIDNQKVAVKISNRNSQISQQEKNVLKSLKSISHRNVIKILDIFESGSVLFIFLEYCTGGSLFEMMLLRNKIDEQKIVNIITQVAKGLQFLHQQNIVHRDIKPENILRQFEQNEEIYKITDFGLSSIKSDRMTTQGVGTAYYVAPEILEGFGYNKSVDIWAMGLILDELIHGTPFFNGKSEEEVHYKIKVENYQIRNKEYQQANIFERRKEIIKNVLNGCLNKDPKQRKDLDYIVAKLNEYQIDSPIQEQKFQNNDRYFAQDISTFNNLETTQVFQQPESDFKYCPYHHLLIRYRMPTNKETQFGCEKCISNFGILEIKEYKDIVQAAYNELSSQQIDIQEQSILQESLKYLQKFHILKESAKLTLELRYIIQQQITQYKVEHSQKLNDLKNLNNAKWIDDALITQKSTQNKIVAYIQMITNERKELIIKNCIKFIRDQLIFLKDKLK